MRLFKAMLSVALVLVMICSCCAVSLTASAVTTKETPVATNPNLQDNIQDGVILHAFCWGYDDIKENLAAIAAAGYTAVQTSPVQQPKDYSASTNISGQWWKLYQPVSLSIADNSWLGTKTDLRELCAEADKYGIKIICDIVSNHLGAFEDASTKLDDEVATYEPVLYNGAASIVGNPYFHQNFKTANDSDAALTTQGISSACPDLNTGNKTVQQKVADLLKECIDCGVDGFRFDAAKHIETPSDSVSSDYWPTVIGTATDYAKEKGVDLYVYGEILNTPGSGRNFNFYTPYMSITDNSFGKTTLDGVENGRPTSISNVQYKVGSADKAVLWAESHDTYFNDGETNDVSEENIIKAWAMVASRKDATALYFVRPGSMAMGSISNDTAYKSVAVAEINKFHNNFVGQSEAVGASGNFAYVVRGTSGIVITNTKGTTSAVSISGTGLADGSYTDMITGNKFTVSGGTVSGNIGSTGVAVVTTGTTTPTVSASKENSTFESETLTVKLTLSNATSGTYQLENYAPVTFTGSPTIRIGSDYNYGDTITLTLTATDGVKTTKTVYKYVKKESSSSGVYVILPASVISSSNWKAPVFCYIYDEKTVAKTEYKNNAWPGEEMAYDEALDAYYVQVPDSACYKQAVGSQTVTETTFNLAGSANTNVIISDSSTSASGASQGKQYPDSTSKKTLALNGKSHKFTAINTTGWVETTEIPGQQADVDATEALKTGETTPTESTAPALQDKIGDVNLDTIININDTTAIQKHIAYITRITNDLQLVLADTNKDGKITIKDATLIQKYAAGMDSYGSVGEVVNKEDVVVPTEPTTTAPTDAPTDAPTVPADTYKIYFKTLLPWMTSMGCSVYAYDNSTGESYVMEQDTEAYPNVFIAEVPKSCTNVTLYRAMAAVTDPTATTEAYNLMPATLSETNNCYILNAFPDGGAPDFSVGPYVAESAPEFELSRLYVDNSAAKWDDIYVYGWGYGMFNDTTQMTKIEGTDIWYLDLPDSIPSGVETFLLKNTAGGTEWVKQSANVTITEPYNCYKISATNKGEGTWYTYNG